MKAVLSCILLFWNTVFIRSCPVVYVLYIDLTPLMDLMGESQQALTACHLMPRIYHQGRVGAVVRALASHQCVPGSIPGPSVICGLSLLLVLYSAQRGFSPGTPVFLSPQKPAFPNSNSNLECTGISERVL